MYTALVLSSMSFAKSSGSFELVNLVVIPKRGNKTLNWLYVPPYNVALDTILSPALAKVAIVKYWAACPELEAIAATPPSRAAIRFSKTSLVGLPILNQG